MTDALDAFEDLASGRRSSLLLSPDEPVDRALVARLVALVGTAPNHKRTRPWRVAAAEGEARLHLGALWASDLEDAGVADGERLAKVRRKYARSASVLVVGCAPDADPVRHHEDLLATAAGLQTVLLAASASGLGALWATPPLVISPRLNEAAGWEVGTEVVGVVYLGWPTGPVPAAERPAPPLHWLAPRSDQT